MRPWAFADAAFVAVVLGWFVWGSLRVFRWQARREGGRAPHPSRIAAPDQYDRAWAVMVAREAMGSRFGE